MNWMPSETGPASRAVTIPDRLPAGTSPDRGTPCPVTLRAVLLGLALIPPTCLCTVWLEEVDNTAQVTGPYPTIAPLLFTAVVLLLGLLLTNRLLEHLRGKPWLSPFDLLVVYSMVAMGSIFSGTDQLMSLIGSIAYVPWGISQGTENLGALIPHLPRWGMLNDWESIQAFYRGNSTLYTATHLHAWLAATWVWLVYIALLLFTMLCINSVVRRQWSQHERLTFPITQLPLALVMRSAGATPFWSSRPLWIGIGIAAGTEILNGLNRLYPGVPAIPTNRQYLPQPLDAPWNAVGRIVVQGNPWAVGLGLLLPADLLFSISFFYFFWRAEFVAASALGFRSDGMPYADQQCFGAYVAIIGFAAWTGRAHLRHLLQRDPCRGNIDTTEALPARAALFGAVAAFAALIFFARAMGMSSHLALTFVGLYLFAAVCVARVRAEMGPPVQDFPGLPFLITGLTGVRLYSPRDLTVLAYFSWNVIGFRSHPMPQQMESLRLAERSGGSLRGMAGALLLAGVVGAAASFWAMLHEAYHYGASARMYTWLTRAGPGLVTLAADGWTGAPESPSLGSVLAVLTGLGFATMLMVMRMRFLWWPLHPMGFAVAGGICAGEFWLPMLVSWIAKALVVRYMGLTGYRMWLVPLAYGLILGDFVSGSLWAVVSRLAGTKFYSFFP